MKVKNLIQDIGGASRVTKARLNAFENASPSMTSVDPIGDVSREWHPGRLSLVVTQVRPEGKTAKTIRLERKDGKKLPFFYAGQFIAIELPIGESYVTRPYSISSAPWEARAEHPFVEFTVRRSRGDGFVCDYLYENAKAGDEMTGTMGCGQFYYEPLRDAFHVMALAGGIGITPFISMAKEVAAGKLAMDLTILYGSADADDILMKEELDALEGEHVHIVHVLSGDDPNWKGERGFLTAELIRKYSAEDTTYFICGPQVMYTFLRKELEKLDLPRRRVRFEVFGPVKEIAAVEGYPAEKKDETFTLTVVRGIHEDKIPAKASESLVTALERAAIRIDTGCRSGECGFCRTKVLSGDYFINPTGDGRRAADKEFGYVHACAAYPLSDMKIKIPIL